MPKRKTSRSDSARRGYDGRTLWVARPSARPYTLTVRLSEDELADLARQQNGETLSDTVRRLIATAPTRTGGR